MTKLEARREAIRDIQSEVNSPKSRLIELLSRTEAHSPKLARKLETLIGKLEAWQHARP